jgi:hypothetical protein
MYRTLLSGFSDSALFADFSYFIKIQILILNTDPEPGLRMKYPSLSDSETRGKVW